VTSRVRITVPASTANLGSGFDTLGMALSRYDTVDVRIVPSGLTVEVTGEGMNTVPTNEKHLVVRALLAACERLDFRPGGLAVRCLNTIPHARGLGSSAAAVVAGITAGYALAGRPIGEGALQLAGEFEGHADNAAASLYGGAVIAWQEEDGYRAVRLEPHADLRPVVLVPDVRSSTGVTRGLLPDRVPHADAAFAAARAALAVHALTVEPALLLPATADRLHQDYRRPAWPDSLRLVEQLRAAGIAAAVSGAGPAVLAFPATGHLPDDIGHVGFAAQRLEVDRKGVRVEFPG
jgi:homoserine kinase